MVGLEVGAAVGGDDIMGMVDGVTALEAGCVAAAGVVVGGGVEDGMLVGEAAGAWALAMTNKMQKQVET